MEHHDLVGLTNGHELVGEETDDGKLLIKLLQKNDRLTEVDRDHISTCLTLFHLYLFENLRRLG